MESTARSIYMRQEFDRGHEAQTIDSTTRLVSETVVHGVAHINAEPPKNANKEHTPCG